MGELFIELFSEEIPSRLQIDARDKIKLLIDESLLIIIQHTTFKINSGRNYGI